MTPASAPSRNEHAAAADAESERRKTIAPAAFAAAVGRVRPAAAPPEVRRAPIFALAGATFGWGRWALGIICAGALLAVLWIAALIAFPDHIARALAFEPGAHTDPPAVNRAPATPAAASALATHTPTPTRTPRPTSTLVVRPTATPTLTPFPTASPAGPGLHIPSRLVIPSLDLDAPVVPVSWTLISRGDTTEAVWDVASRAVGWHINSALPGQGGNVVMAGHHNIEGMVFRDLYTLEAGAEIRLIAGPITYEYRVRDVMIVPEEGVSAEQREENARWIGEFPEERLTLLTCWPFVDNTHRVIIVAFPPATGEPDGS